MRNPKERLGKNHLGKKAKDVENLDSRFIISDKTLHEVKERVTRNEFTSFAERVTFLHFLIGFPVELSYEYAEDGAVSHLAETNQPKALSSTHEDTFQIMKIFLRQLAYKELGLKDDERKNMTRELIEWSKKLRGKKS